MTMEKIPSEILEAIKDPNKTLSEDVIKDLVHNYLNGEIFDHSCCSTHHYVIAYTLSEDGKTAVGVTYLKSDDCERPDVFEYQPAIYEVHLEPAKATKVDFSPISEGGCRFDLTYTNDEMWDLHNSGNLMPKPLEE